MVKLYFISTVALKKVQADKLREYLNAEGIGFAIKEEKY